MRRLISDRKHKKNTDLKCVHIVYTYTGVCIHNVMDIPMCIYIQGFHVYIYNIYIYIYVFCLCSRYPYTFTYVGFLYITLCSIYTGCIKTCISFMQSYVYLLCWSCAKVHLHGFMHTSMSYYIAVHDFEPTSTHGWLCGDLTHVHFIFMYMHMHMVHVYVYLYNITYIYICIYPHLY